MSNSPSMRWFERAGIRLDREDPYLRMQSVTTYVRDHDKSLAFYVDQLGFRIAYDYRVNPARRWTALAPPDGTTFIVILKVEPNCEEYARIGTSTGVVFITEDVNAKFHEWSKRCSF